MPLISQFFLKTGFIWLIISLFLFGYQSVDTTVRILYHHTLGLGWVTQIIIGVAIWMFPRWSNELPKGPMWMWWTSYVTLNLGLLLRIISEYYYSHSVQVFAPLLFVAGLLLWTSMILFVIVLWKRVLSKTVH